MTTERDPRDIDTPSFAAAPSERPRAERWVWIGCGVLLVTLITMLLVAGRTSLAADARTRPLAERACAVLGCNVPAWRDAGAFRMLEHDVRSDPAIPGDQRRVIGPPDRRAAKADHLAGEQRVARILPLENGVGAETIR